ncbi:MAG: iron-sulfur cluster assembly protein, partial [Alphaproteobacteria bacterium]|nr:iron-sulfur cluster assembly protein [Alphaproteobacteria bacterium]
LIYDMEQAEDGSVRIEMSLTAPGCPVAGEMPGMVAEAVAAVQGVGEVEVLLVWEPAWTMERMSEEARLALDMW